MKEEIAIRALSIIEREAGSLRRELKKGKELGWEDVKIIIKALGILAGDGRIQEEAAKKHWFYKHALGMFAEFTKRL